MGYSLPAYALSLKLKQIQRPGTAPMVPMVAIHMPGATDLAMPVMAAMPDLDMADTVMPPPLMLPLTLLHMLVHTPHTPDFMPVTDLATDITWAKDLLTPNQKLSQNPGMVLTCLMAMDMHLAMDMHTPTPTPVTVMVSMVMDTVLVMLM